ncbi:MAG: tetratricopeptide repeat protein [Gloeobacteraceae cyanobacterium ES-bin-316]|nr:tetratricopeptide repeat protein [Ferruginibacter sp.]
MKNKPVILIFAGLVLTVALFLFGRTTEPKKALTPTESVTNSPSFSISSFIDSVKTRLSPAQSLYITELENGITRGDVPAQQIQSYNRLAAFYKDSAKLFEPYAYYTYEASKLDNSEKKLTFAAQLFLEAVRGEHEQAQLAWKTGVAIELFEKALKLNPESDELKIGLGSSYIFGTGRTGDPQQTMKGIQELLSVVKKDSSNMRAQFVLGVGGFVSGQYDKAIERFAKVVNAQPENMEAIAFLADTYAAKGDKENAVKWYNISKRLANNPLYTKEVDERIKKLQ